jgi:hypothetical protein
MPRTDDVIFVTNKNDFHHEDGFDGELYSFPPGEKVAISMDAARHMFGFGLKDKTETLVRVGWAMKPVGAQGYVQDPEGIKKLANFVFTRAVMVEESVPEPAEDLPIA